jgi:hypothetical protein
VSLVRYLGFPLASLIDTSSHFIREGAIAILQAPVQPVQAQVDLMDERGGLVA